MVGSLRYTVAVITVACPGFLCCTSLLLLSDASAQSTDTLVCEPVAPEAGKLGYQKRPLDKKEEKGLQWCEGLYQPRVSSTHPIELLNFSILGQPLDETTKLITVTSFKLSNAHNECRQNFFRVVGRSIAPDVFYRLDLDLAPDERSMGISTSEVITKAGIRAEQIGFVAYCSQITSTSTTSLSDQYGVVPLIVQPCTDGVSSQACSLPPAGINVSIRVNSIVTKVAWKWRKACSSREDPVDWHSALTSPFPPQFPIVFRLTSLPSEYCQLTIQVTDDNDETLEESWNVLGTLSLKK